MDDLVSQSAATMARMIREKQVSSREVIEAHLKRIEEINPAVNAIVVVTADAALAEARRLDEDLARGEVKGPLHGVPITIKDAIETAGIVTTGGTKGRATYVPSEDATVVRRLKDAGAVLIGKTNLPELSLFGEADNLIYGRTNNPYDASRVPGGSSGGEAAAIAAGESPLGIGSDVGGSVRLPAHFCGIAGIKPTSGRVPRTGHFPSSDGILDRMWQLGPMARFVEDLTLCLPIVSGPDGLDPGTFPVESRDPAEVDVTSIRVAFHTDIPEAPVIPEMERMVRSSASALSDAGAKVEEARPAALDRIKDMSYAFFRADGGESVRRILNDAGTTDIHPMTQELQALAGGHRLSVEDLAEVLVWIDEFRRAMLGFIGEYDAILCPTHSHAAVLHGTSNADEYYPGYLYAIVHNLTGWPGTVVRAGTSDDGLPLGIQVVAGPWREDISLALAQRIEDALGGWRRPPF